MTSQTGCQTTTIHIFGQLIEYNIRDIFLGKSCKKSGKEISPTLFFKKSKLITSFYHQFHFLHGLFLLYIQVEDYQNILKLRC